MWDIAFLKFLKSVQMLRFSVLFFIMGMLDTIPIYFSYWYIWQVWFWSQYSILFRKPTPINICVTFLQWLKASWCGRRRSGFGTRKMGVSVTYRRWKMEDKEERMRGRAKGGEKRERYLSFVATWSLLETNQIGAEALFSTLMFWNYKCLKLADLAQAYT